MHVDPVPEWQNEQGVSERETSSQRQAQGRDGLRGDAFAAAGEAELLGRRRLDADPARARSPRISATRATIASRCGPIFGRSQMMVTSRWAMLPPLARTSAAACARKRSDAAPRHCGSLGGKCMPISPAPSAPRIASVSACSPTSASEWPTSAALVRHSRRRRARHGRRDRRDARRSPGRCGYRRAAPRSAARRAARSSAVVTLKLSSLPATIERRDARRPRRPRHRRSDACPAAARCAARIASKAKSLRRLRPPQSGAVDRLGDAAVGDRASPCRRAAAPGSRPALVERVEHAVDQRGVGKRPRAVVDQHALGRDAAPGLEAEPHRILPLRAARHRRQQIEPGQRGIIFRVGPPVIPLKSPVIACMTCDLSVIVSGLAAMESNVRPSCSCAACFCGCAATFAIWGCSIGDEAKASVSAIIFVLTFLV